MLRWLMASHPVCDKLILWAGSIPDELDYTPHLPYFSKIDTHFAYGDQDEFLTPERLDKLRALAKTKGLEWEEMPFEGQHTVPEAALLRMQAKIKQ